MNLKIDFKKVMMVMVLVIVLVGIMIFTGSNEDRFYEVVKSNEAIAKENANGESLLQDESQNKLGYEEIKVSEPQKAIVYICGAVKTPIVAELTTEHRLNDAVKVAGGLIENANAEGVNLAMRLTDGAQYIIPEKNEELVINYGEANTSKVDNLVDSQNDGKVNINVADQKELMELTGIGEVISMRIIEYRKEHNGFKSIEELKQVEGIGDKKYSDIKEQVTV